MLPVNRISFQPIESCLNCGKALEGQHKFCNTCGAKKVEERFTPKRLMHEAGERIFNLDNTFLRTFFALFLKPEEVIGGFLVGLRKRYLNAFGYFTISITISGIQIFVLKRFYPNVLEQAVTVNGNGFGRTIQETLYEYQPVVMFSTIPIIAFMGWLTFYTLRKHNFTEHLIIQLYAYSHLSILATLFGVLTLMLGVDYTFVMLISLPFYVVYNAHVFKRLYNLSLGKIFLRTLLFLGILITVYILVTVVVMTTLVVIDPGFFKEMAAAAQ